MGGSLCFLDVPYEKKELEKDSCSEEECGCESIAPQMPGTNAGAESIAVFVEEVFPFCFILSAVLLCFDLRAVFVRRGRGVKESAVEYGGELCFVLGIFFGKGAQLLCLGSVYDVPCSAQQPCAESKNEKKQPCCKSCYLKLSSVHI